MDIISTTLSSMTQPSGFWVSILNAFNSVTGTYILSVILLAIIVRILFSVVDIINKKVNMKNMNLNEKMKPELEAIQKRYGNDPKVMQQKQSEIYKKYQFSMMGTCLPMLVTMILQFVVFLTLWNSLQAVSNYNISNQYQNMKYLYANVIELNNESILIDKLEPLKDQEYTLNVEIDYEKNRLKVFLKTPEMAETEVVLDKEYKTEYTNQVVADLIDSFVIVPTPEEPEVETQEYIDTNFNVEIKTLAESTVKKYFQDTQEKFLWIKNIYRPESPTSPLFTEKEITGYLSKYYDEEEKASEEANHYEEKIFNSIITENTQFKDVKSEKNGFYILTILAVLTSVLSLWLSNKLMQGKKKTAQPGGKMMYFIMPLIIGIFTFMYTSLFAIYLIVGQLVMMALTPLNTIIVRKWIELDDKKKKKKAVVEVDYRRKDD